MLVVTRKLGEVVLVGDNIKITIVQIKGQQVRIGIEAPKDILVLREELKDEKASVSGLAREDN